MTLAESGWLGGVDLDGFLAIAESLALELAALHARGLVHGAIRPSTILLHAEDARTRVDDPAPARFVFAEPVGPTPPLSLPLDPTYCAPEQTGRLNRPIDARTDLYALGLVLYALATGDPPFRDTDRIALIHAHLTRDPSPPRQRVPWLPDPPERLILTLLAKEPDDRYQSAAGLVHDLQRLRAAVAAREPLEHIPLRRFDPPPSPRPPRRLHGRERELATLMANFMEATEGQSRALFVAGYSGIGKTALIRQIRRPVILNQGWFVSGKCAQFQRDRPWLALADALGQLCRLLLAESDERRKSWRQGLLTALGHDASALFELLPDLERLLGAQPPAPPLGPVESQTRRLKLLVSLVRRVATPEQPLVLVLDDLQWADRPSLDFIDALLEDTGLQGLLLIGAYRDNEIDESHPLIGLSSRTDGRTTLLKLSNLSPEILARLLAERLSLPVNAVESLASRLHEKTSGNPFFTLELLDALRRAGVLRLDPRHGGWIWEETALQGYPVSPNLADLLTQGLSELPDDTREILLTIACLGERLSLGRLAVATGCAPDALVEALVPALERGVLIAVDTLAMQTADPSVELRFGHDRMQQAAYQLRDEYERARLQRVIAHRLIQGGDPGERFSAAEQFAAAISQLDDEAERRLARQLFAEAALQTRRSGTLATAERFLRLGLEALGADIWHRDARLAFDLQAELHLVLYSQARHAEADSAYARLASVADDPLTLVEPTCVQIAALSDRTRYHEAITLGCGLLERLGLSLPMHDLDRSLQRLVAEYPDIFRMQGRLDREPHPLISPNSALGRELAAFDRHLATGVLERLPPCSDRAGERASAAARLLNSLIPAAGVAHPLLAAWLSLRVGRLWIEEGYCDAVIYPTLSAAVSLMAFRGYFATAERLARTVLEVGADCENHRETARAWAVYLNYVSHWGHPIESSLAQVGHTIGELERVADLEFAALTRLAVQAARLDTGARLADLEIEIESALDLARRAGNRHSEQGHLIYRQLIRALRGRTSGPGAFDDAEFDERAFKSAVQGVAGRSRRLAPSRLRAFIVRLIPIRYLFRWASWGFAGDPWGNPVALCYFHIYRALAACLFDDAPAFVHHAETAVALTLFVYGTYPTAHINLLHSLALIQRLRTAPKSLRGPLLERIALNQQWLAARAAEAPMNFSHLQHLIEAERLDAIGQPWAALQTIEQAMRHAWAHQRPWQKALITERAGLLHMRNGLEHSGRHLLRRACQLYQDWGATGKVEAMRNAWPFVAKPQIGETAAEDPDQAALLRAAAVLATETSCSELMTRVMRLIAQSTGATDVRFLALDEEDRWHLESGLRGSDPLEPRPLPQAEAEGLVAMSLLRLGLATQGPVISEDAVLDTRFAADPVYARLPLCALLGLPVMVQGRVTAFLILENRRLRAAFGADQPAPVDGETPMPHSLRLAALGGFVALHALVEARNQSLLTANHQALDQARQALDEAGHERALRSRQEHFIDLISHEYRTPLAIMQTNLDILTLPQDSARWHKALTNMEKAVERLGVVFDGSLRRDDWGGQRALHLEPIDLPSRLSRRLDDTLASWPAPVPAIELRIREPAGIQADPALLDTVLINLLDNARKYGPPEGPITVELMRRADLVVIRIGNDCAPDLARESLDLLAKSVRGPNSHGVPGLGMGLYLVNKLVEDQGGRVELRLDRPGRFEIELIFPANPRESMP